MDLGQNATVGDELNQPCHEQEAGNEQSGYIEYAQCLPFDGPLYFREGSIHEHRVDKNDDQSEFSWPEAAVSEQELTA